MSKREREREKEGKRNLCLIEKHLSFFLLLSSEPNGWPYKTERRTHFGFALSSSGFWPSNNPGRSRLTMAFFAHCLPQLSGHPAVGDGPPVRWGSIDWSFDCRIIATDARQHHYNRCAAAFHFSSIRDRRMPETAICPLGFLYVDCRIFHVYAPRRRPYPSQSERKRETVKV